MIKKINNRFSIFFKKKIFNFLKKRNYLTLRRLVDATEYLERKKNFYSVIFWTTHKSASVFLSSFLELVAKESNLSHLDYSKEIWNFGNQIKLNNPFEIEKNCNFLYRPFGEIYGPMRTPFDFEIRKNMNNIFF